MHYFKRLCVAIFVLAILTGCATAFVDGQKLAAVDAPIERVGVSLNPVKFKGGDVVATLAGNDSVARLFPHLASRVPVIFALNGIESRAMIEKNGLVSQELNTFPYVLRVIPKWIYMSSQSGTGLELAVNLFDTERERPIWRGTIMLKAFGFGVSEDDFADEFSRKLLKQLNEDGYIKLKGAEVQMAKK